MRAVLCLVLAVTCFEVTFSEVRTYKAGVVDFMKNDHRPSIAEVIKEAGKLNVDILMLPLPQKAVQRSSQNYDLMIQTVSKAAKQSGVYVAAQLHNQVRCDNQYGEFENTVIFGRDGSLISIFRKPTNSANSCNSTSEETISFTTDFGTTFNVIAAEDIVLQNPESLARDVKNFIVAGDWVAELPFLTLNPFLSTWSQSVGANLLISSGIYTGKEVRSVSIDSAIKILVAELETEPKFGQTSHQPCFSQSKPLHHEDMSQYTIKPLDLEAASRGYKETVCHGDFCCQFYVKTDGAGQDTSNYSFAVYDGDRTFGSSHNIGVQNCAVVACAGSSKSSCIIGSNNGTSDVVFDQITVSANFSEENGAQFPATLTSSFLPLSVNEYTFDSRPVNNKRQVTVKLESSSDLLTFGIFGRHFAKDLDNDKIVSGDILPEDLNEFFDYVWIRLRILIFVVSIYFLEMM